MSFPRSSTSGLAPSARAQVMQRIHTMQVWDRCRKLIPQLGLTGFKRGLPIETYWRNRYSTNKTATHGGALRSEGPGLPP